jgi:polysaccharide deacetylase family protein (PEP-CTERM system associated)
MINALTIDVEDYHSIVARDWLGRDMKPTRAVVDNTTRLMEMIAERGFHGTFFILGEVAEAFPQLVRDIAAAGHEIGVHGYFHRLVFKLRPEQFRDEISRAKSLIEDIAGVAALGHRAPAFSILPENRWAFDVIAEAGFRYDASIRPLRGGRYGWPGFSPAIHTMTLDGGRELIEAPNSMVTLLGLRLPACGGGYLRHFPAVYTDWAFRHLQSRRPAILYAHPYEIELNVPPLDTTGLPAPTARRARRFHAMQLRKRETVEGKIRRVLARYDFAPLRDVINQVLQQPGMPAPLASPR